MRHSGQNRTGPTSFEQFFDSRAGAVVAISALVLSVGLTTFLIVGTDFIDLLVYRLGATVLLDDGGIYGALPAVVDDFGLPFTYPPLAAILFVPLALIPVGLGKFAFSLVSVAALAVTLRMVLGRVRRQWSTRAAWTATAAAVAAALLLEPVRETISFGQINIVLMALVAVDVLARKPKWPRGVLIGLAAAVKLTPIGFLLLFLLRRDWRTSGHILGGALGLTALAYVFMPGTSTKYWSEILPNTDRIGAAYFANNLSLKAVISRFGPPEHLGSALWLVAAALALAVAVLAIRRALFHGDVVLALAANATAILLASPVSWSHHWVWVAPTLLALVLGLTRPLGRATAATATGIGAIFLIGPHHLLPSRDDHELDWMLWQHLLGTLYVSIGVGFLLWLAHKYRKPSTDGSFLINSYHSLNRE